MSIRESFLWGRPSVPHNETTKQSILNCLRMLAPFQEAVPQWGFADGDMVEGIRQFYAFIKDLYSQMYADPGFFLVPEQGQSREAVRRAIQFYAAYLYQLGTRAESLESGVLILGQPAWKEVRKGLEDSQARFQRLQVLGLDQRTEPGGVYVTSRDFPKMLYGLWALCNAPDNQYRYMDYLRLDYAAALRGQPRAEDLLRMLLPLSPQRHAAVQAVHSFLLEQGCCPVILPLSSLADGLWQMEYQREGTGVLLLSAGPDRLTLRAGDRELEEPQTDQALRWLQEFLLGEPIPQGVHPTKEEEIKR